MRRIFLFPREVGDQGSTRVNDILHQFPFSLTYSGYVVKESGATVDQGTNGNWWSHGANSTTHARYLILNGNYTSPENSVYKTYGLSVRCVVVKFTTLLSVITCKISCLSL
ncbi:hypothetical protein IJU22_00585 [Candidatus Saccharibacteria bacterium]|nr:hypothetical protein [Candidatus Saccharibacteria bacterium]